MTHCYNTRFKTRRFVGMIQQTYRSYTMRQKRHRAATMIATCYRRFKHLFPNRRQDPITLGQLTCPIFKHVHKKDNSTTYFHAPTLAQYIQSSGDYRNPLTREALNIVETRRLERLAKIVLPDIDIVTTMTANLFARKARLERQAMLEYLQQATLSAVDDALTCAASLDIPITQKIYRCNWTYFPRIQNSIVRLANYDRDNQVYSSMKSTILSTIQEANNSHLYYDECVLDLTSVVVTAAFNRFSPDGTGRASTYSAFATLVRAASLPFRSALFAASAGGGGGGGGGGDGGGGGGGGDGGDGGGGGSGMSASGRSGVWMFAGNTI